MLQVRYAAIILTYSFWLFALVESNGFLRNGIETEKKHEVKELNATFREKGGYQFDMNFESLKNVFTCSIYSSAYNCTFNKTTTCASLEPNIRSWINGNRCQFALTRITDRYPLYWEMKIEDQSGNTLLHKYSVTFYYITPIVLEKIDLIENTTFMQYIALDVKMKTCRLSAYKTEATLSLDSTDVELLTQDSPIRGRIESVGRGKCGFKVIDSRSGDPNSYNLIAYDVDDRGYMKDFSVKFLTLKAPNVTHYVYPATKLDIMCELEKRPTFGKDGFCSLYNPNGELVKSGVNSCTMTIIVGATDYGTWRCTLGLQEKIESVTMTTSLKYKDLQQLKPLYEETDEYLRIGCFIANPEREVTPEYCVLTDPRHDQFQISPTSASVRYTTLTLNLTAYVCSIEISKPLLESEIGQWLCEIGELGGAFDVAKPTHPLYKSVVDRTTREGNPHLIFCKIPVSSQYCFITAPNGTKYESIGENDWWIGECSLNITNINAVDNGRWICHFAMEMGKPFEKIAYNLQVAENLTYYEEVDADPGDSVNLMCSTQGAAIKHCMYESPSKDVFYVYENGVSETFDYYGKGFIDGDCGITIKKVRTLDSGNWTCILKMFDSEKDEKETIALSVHTPLDAAESGVVETTTLATSVGIGVGLVIVVLTAIGLDLYRRRRKNRIAYVSRQNEQDNNNIPLSTIGPAEYLLANNRDRDPNRNRDNYITINESN